MAKLPSSFNAEDHGEMGSFDLIPEKTQLHVKIVESDYKRNSKDNGDVLKLKREVLSGEYKGKFVFSNLSVVHEESKTAVEMAQKELASTCRACGIIAIQEDTEELHGIEHMIEVGISKGAGDWPDSNSIRKIWAMEGVESPTKPGGAKKETADPGKKESAAPKRKKPVFE